MPPIVQQIKSALQSRLHVASWVWSNRSSPRIGKTDRDERLATCYGCDKLQDNRCSECGCFVKLKASLVTEHCPWLLWHTDADLMETLYRKDENDVERSPNTESPQEKQLRSD